MWRGSRTGISCLCAGSGASALKTVTLRAMASMDSNFEPPNSVQSGHNAQNVAVHASSTPATHRAALKTQVPQHFGVMCCPQSARVTPRPKQNERLPKVGIPAVWWPTRPCTGALCSAHYPDHHSDSVCATCQTRAARSSVPSSLCGMV